MKCKCTTYVLPSDPVLNPDPTNKYPTGMNPIEMVENKFVLVDESYTHCDRLNNEVHYLN